jgi:hypothetical protein
MVGVRFFSRMICGTYAAGGSVGPPLLYVTSAVYSTAFEWEVKDKIILCYVKSQLGCSRLFRERDSQTGGEKIKMFRFQDIQQAGCNKSVTLYCEIVPLGY